MLQKEKQMNTISPKSTPQRKRTFSTSTFQASQHLTASSFLELLHNHWQIVPDKFPDRFRRIPLNQRVQKTIQQKKTFIVCA
jgi:hypothetical protein